MVNSQGGGLDRTFAALSDPTRRALLSRLDEGEGLTVSELARPFPISLPAIMKHLDVLSAAGLIERSKSGRTVTCTLRTEPMREAMGWLAHYERYWTQQLDRLTAFLEDDKWPASPASRSSAASTRRPGKSTKPGRSPRK
jgi:DNA-binding transcriptional ArsR family regulator